MNIILSHKKNSITLLLFSTVTFVVLLFTLLTATACKPTIRYFDYVSELRNNIFLAKTETLSLRIHAVVKESPYSSDGVPRETFSRMEAHLTAPEGNKTAHITIQVDEKSYGGEMSYDIVKGEYYYACSIDVSKQSELLCLVAYGEEECELNAISVLTESTITPQNALKKLQTEKEELFSSLTDKYGFAGEIYLRLLFEDSPYYYIGIIDRQGRCTAFLMNAETGKILAERHT